MFRLAQKTHPRGAPEAEEPRANGVLVSSWCAWGDAVVFQIYGEISIAGSFLFLIIQLISIINFIYVWNDAWLEDERM